MKTLILYVSQKGFIREAAERLQKELGEDAVLCDLKKKSEGPENYDTLVFSGAFHAGKLPGKLFSYIKKHEEAFKTKKTAFLLGGADQKLYAETFKKNVPPPMADMNLFYVGGRYLPEQHGWIIRKIMTKISGKEGPLHNEKWEVVEALAKSLHP